MLYYPDENRELKEEIEQMRKSSAELESAHSRQMAEALDNLNTLTEAHKAEMTSQLHTMQLKRKLEKQIIESSHCMHYYSKRTSGRQREGIGRESN